MGSLLNFIPPAKSQKTHPWQGREKQDFYEAANFDLQLVKTIVMLSIIDAIIKQKQHRSMVLYLLGMNSSFSLV
jgi:hypothetical protein